MANIAFNRCVFECSDNYDTYKKLFEDLFENEDLSKFGFTQIYEFTYYDFDCGGNAILFEFESRWNNPLHEWKKFTEKYFKPEDECYLRIICEEDGMAFITCDVFSDNEWYETQEISW